MDDKEMEYIVSLYKELKELDTLADILGALLMLQDLNVPEFNIAIKVEMLEWGY